MIHILITIKAKEKLEKFNKIKFIFDKVMFVKQIKNKIKIITEKNKVYSGDIISNVAGPVNILDMQEESSLIYSLKNITKKYSKSGFVSNKNFKISKNINDFEIDFKLNNQDYIL